MRLAAFILVFISFVGNAQRPQVPSILNFAGIELKIQPGARAEIQRDVDALTHSPKYYKIKANRAAQYFPIIERIFKEEGLPEDFKYLVLQESALIPDAVSSSNAVGFWQFKKASGGEMGLRMDRQVDERMNIVSSSRAAAGYLQKNNYYFNNWVIALQAYQMGAGAAMDAVGEKYNGAKRMTIDKGTYWYVKKFLAHFVAFQEVKTQPGFLKEFDQGGNMSLQEISKRYDVDHESLVAYNKWLRRGQIPMDKNYSVIIPGEDVTISAPIVAAVKPKSETEFDDSDAVMYPQIDAVDLPNQPFILKVNGILGIVSRESDRIESLAEKGGLDVNKFMKYNEIEAGHRVRDGQVYYLNAKKNKSRIYYHVFQYEETLWQVAQKYGIKLTALMKKNHITDQDMVKPGRVLWLHKKRPKVLEPQYRSVDPPVKVLPVTTVKRKAVVTKPVYADHQTESPPQVEDPVIHETPEPLPVNNKTSNVEEPKTRPDNSSKNFTTHTVAAGETLYSIGRMYNVSINDVLSWNGISINDPLSTGQELKVIPKDKEPISELEQKFEDESTDFMTYKVLPGDTYYKISRQFNVSVEDLKKWNNKSDNSLNVGEDIRIRR